MEKALPALRATPFLILVIPCYNEEAILPNTIGAVKKLLDDLKSRGMIREQSCACYVDDGSSDATWEILQSENRVDPCCRAVKFAGNAGHQNAVWAGMATARQWGADCIVSMDADLQDDIGVIPQMLELYAQHNDIVYGVRSSRDTDTAFKRMSARCFYALMRKLNLSMIPDHADYRLVSRPVLEALRGFEEHNLFLRGLFPLLGFRTARVYYRRQPRRAGQSKYPLAKMLAFAWQGITSCSAAPLRIAGLLSFVTMIFAMLVLLVTLYKYAMGEVIQGWTSLIIVILFLGSAQMFCLAVMGEYIAKIFTEVRRRPRYIIEKYL